MDDVNATTINMRVLHAEIVRLNKVVNALVNRAERGASVESSNFGLFQTTLVLEDQVRRKTEDLEKALRKIERIHRDLQQAQAHLQEQAIRLQEQAIRDPLTGLYNRRHLDEVLSRELIRARRHNLSLCLVMIDIDHFKFVNDTYGHTAGDEVLKTVGTLLQRSLREYDYSCRYGGEEFLLILPAIEEDSARKRIGQLREAVEVTKTEYSAAAIQVTASFGVAMFPADGQNGMALIAASDKALYGAKTGGRNRVEFCNSH